MFFSNQVYLFGPIGLVIVAVKQRARYAEYIKLYVATSVFATLKKPLPAYEYFGILAQGLHILSVLKDLLPFCVDALDMYRTLTIGAFNEGKTFATLASKFTVLFEAHTAGVAHYEAVFLTISGRLLQLNTLFVGIFLDE